MRDATPNGDGRAPAFVVARRQYWQGLARRATWRIPVTGAGPGIISNDACHAAMVGTRSGRKTPQREAMPKTTLLVLTACAKVASRSTTCRDVMAAGTKDVCAPPPPHHAPRGVPHQVWAVGRTVFNHDEAKLEALVNATAAPTCHVFSCRSPRGGRLEVVSMLLVQDKGDTGIKRLAGEARWDFTSRSAGASGSGDGYGIRLANATVEGDLIIDVGSNLGDVSIAAAKLFPTARILAIEPNPITYFFMLWNFHLNGFRPHPVLLRSGSEGNLRALLDAPKGGLIALNAALGHRKMLVYARPGDSLGALAVPAEGAEAEAKGRVRALLQQHPESVPHEVAAVDLPALLPTKGVHFLKMDCEGCEYSILPGWHATGFLSRVRLFSGETHQRYQADIASKAAVQQTESALFARGCKRPRGRSKEFLFPC